MNNLRYEPMKLKHKVINRWYLSKLQEETVSFTPMTMEGDINKWLIEGFAINENPCKKEFREKRRNNVPESLQFMTSADNDLELYFPWGNPAVERSGFWFVPTYLKSYAFTYLECSQDHKANLKLKTCGGMTLWVNDKFITDFTPFTRNIEGNTTVEVELKKGLNSFMVCFDDLAERDTYYYFRIDYLGEDEINIVLPAGDNDVTEINSIESMLTEAYFTNDTVKEGEVVLQIRNKLNRDLEFEFEYETEQLTDNDSKKKSRVCLKRGLNRLSLGEVSNFPMGFNYIDILTITGTVKIERKLGAQIFDISSQKVKEAKTIVQRKEEALKFIAKNGDYNVHKALAILSAGGDVKEAEGIILRGIDGINKRRDCSDFYLISIFRIWKEYRNKGIFSEDFWDKVKKCILNFRYWIDELGDDVMWFFSENHSLLFHSCELLAGQLFPEEIFTNSNENGRFHKNKAEELLTKWFERFFVEGLAEWNSSMYMPVDVVGVINIYELAESEELRKSAKKAMDLIYYLLAVNSHNGVVCTTFGRSYEKELKGQYASGTTSLLWIGYGIGYLNNYSISNVSLCLSKYEPPKEYEEYLSVKKNESYIFKNEQGAGGYAKVYNYRTKDFMLSSIHDFRPGHKGYQEHVIEGFIDPETHVWINNPGQLYNFGAGRPNFWAGNGHLPKINQYKGLCVVSFKIDKNSDADYTHAYFPKNKFDEVQKVGNWIFAKKDSTFIGMYANKGIEVQVQGVNKDRELISKGFDNLWLLRMSNIEEFESFESFIVMLAESEISISENLELCFNDPIYGIIGASWNEELKVAGATCKFESVGVLGSVEKIMNIK